MLIQQAMETTITSQTVLKGLIDEFRINVRVERVAGIRAFLTEQTSSACSNGRPGSEIWKDIKTASVIATLKRLDVSGARAICKIEFNGLLHVINPLLLDPMRAGVLMMNLANHNRVGIAVFSASGRRFSLMVDSGDLRRLVEIAVMSMLAASA